MKAHKKRKDNAFINAIKENYEFLILLIVLVLILNTQGCAPSQPIIDIGGLSLGNCCKIKDPANLQTQACIASTPYPGTCADGSIDCVYSSSVSQEECASIASQTGSSYELVPASDCLNFERNTDCGTDINNHKMGCYLDDGSGNYKFYTQAWPLDSPQFESLSCNSAATSLYMCNRGKTDLVQDCSSSSMFCMYKQCTDKCLLPGDVNGDGMIDTKDQNCIQKRIALELTPECPLINQCSDLNNDRGITITDLSLLSLGNSVCDGVTCLTNEVCQLGQCVAVPPITITTTSTNPSSGGGSGGGGGGGGSGGSGGGAGTGTEIIPPIPVDALGGKTKNVTQETIMPAQTPSATEKPTYFNLFPITKPKSKLESLILYLKLNLPVLFISLLFLILLIIATVYSYKKLSKKKK